MAEPYQILLYYHYTPIPDPAAFLEEHRDLCRSLGLRGRILIGEEGINGTVSGEVSGTEAYMEALREDERTRGIEFKIDPAEGHAFPKLSVKLRPEIVTLGLPKAEDIDPNRLSGKRLSPQEWLEALQDPEVVVLDGRNDYETALGHFRGAVCPPLENFRDFPEWIREHFAQYKNRRVLTYCTGGVRCEKLSGFLLREGFQDVAQLDGGIINYSHDPATRGRLFEGQCYVFDERVVVEVNHTETRTVVSRCCFCDELSARYRNCAWPKCNAQIFICEGCELERGRYCGPSCEEGHRTAE